MNIDHKKQQIMYWGIFFLVCISATQLVLSLISVAGNESTQFSQTVAIERASQKIHAAILHTSKGAITIQFNSRVAPSTINNFIAFASSNFYDGTKFHRVVKDLLIQGGDPLSREKDKSLYGTGGPGFVYEDEIESLPMKYGAVAMANRGKPNTNGSQFFIVTNKNGAPELEGKYTIFGEVLNGKEVVDAINDTPTDIEDIPVEDITITSIELR